MARVPLNSVLAAVALGLVGVAVNKSSRKRAVRKTGKKSQQQAIQVIAEPETAADVELTSQASEPEQLIAKLFGDEKRMCVTVEAVTEEMPDAAAASAAAAAAAAEDLETYQALLQLLALAVSVTASTALSVAAIATGSFLMAGTSVAVGRYIAAPAAAGVRKYWGYALNEALSETSASYTAPWDMSVI